MGNVIMTRLSASKSLRYSPLDLFEEFVKSRKQKRVLGTRLKGMESEPFIGFLILCLPSLDCQLSMAQAMHSFSYLMKVALENPPAAQGVLVTQEAEFQRLCSEMRVSSG